MKKDSQTFLILSLVILLAGAAFGQLDPRERYGTYLGGSFEDCYDPSFQNNCPAAGHNYSFSPADTAATAVAIDKQGYIYVAGSTNSWNFPTTTGAYRRSVHYADNSFGDLFSVDSFLAKFTSTGTLVWSTYLGLVATPQAIAFDSLGNVIVAGSVNTGDLGRYPFDTPFVMKVNAAGTMLVAYKQLLANGSCNSGYGIKSSGAGVDPAGSIYFVGEESYDMNCFVPKAGANQTGAGFVVKVNSALNRLYVARVDGYPAGVTGDTSGNAYITGATSSFVAHVTKLNYLGAIAFTSTFGNSGGGSAIRLASNGDIVATGTAADGSFHATANFGTPTPGGNAAFIVRLHSTGSLVYSAVIHEQAMIPSALALDSADEAFITGSDPATGPGFIFSVNKYSNAPLLGGAFLARLNRSGTALWLDTTFGGNAGLGIAVDAAWNAWVVGQSQSGQYFPITANAYQSSFKNANSQGFLAKLIIEADVKMLIQGASPNPVTHGANLTYTLAVYNNGPDVSDGDTITDVLPAGTTFVSYSTTSGTCTHPAVGYGGTFKCTRSTALNKGSYWGPIKLTVKVNAAAGTTLKNTASVAAKTQDVVPSNNTATVYVKVQ